MVSLLNSQERYFGLIVRVVTRDCTTGRAYGMNLMGHHLLYFSLRYTIPEENYLLRLLATGSLKSISKTILDETDIISLFKIQCLPCIQEIDTICTVYSIEESRTRDLWLQSPILSLGKPLFVGYPTNQEGPCRKH